MIDTNECFVPFKSAAPVMEVVRELRAMGLVQGIDFDFKYQQVKRSYSDNIVLLRNGASFFFKDPKRATMFRLQYDAS